MYVSECVCVYVWCVRVCDDLNKNLNPSLSLFPWPVPVLQSTPVAVSPPSLDLCVLGDLLLCHVQCSCVRPCVCLPGPGMCVFTHQPSLCWGLCKPGVVVFPGHHMFPCTDDELTIRRRREKKRFGNPPPPPPLLSWLVQCSWHCKPIGN